jgi:hypothetical protein
MYYFLDCLTRNSCEDELLTFYICGEWIMVVIEISKALALLALLGRRKRSRGALFSQSGRDTYLNLDLIVLLNQNQRGFLGRQCTCISVQNTALGKLVCTGGPLSLPPSHNAACVESLICQNSPTSFHSVLV